MECPGFRGHSTTLVIFPLMHVTKIPQGSDFLEQALANVADRLYHQEAFDLACRKNSGGGTVSSRAREQRGPTSKRPLIAG